MRLLSYETASGPAAAIQVEDGLVPASSMAAPALTVRGLLEALDNERIPLAEATLCAPIPDARKIICMGLNYRDHAEETGQEIPAAPMWFAKFANSLNGSGGQIVLPAAHPEFVDYEAELALVIGRTARNVAAKDALSHLAGAMPFDDVTARDLQFQNPLWTSGKAIDTFAPCGPALVTLDEIRDLGALQLTTRVNGEVLQQGTTANLIFGPADLIAWLSRTITLLPGDIIATGTPAGIGAAQGRFLRDGDTVEVEIDELGTLVNRVCAE